MARKEDMEELAKSLQTMEDEIDEFLTDKFADLEIALDNFGLKENEYIFKIWDRMSNKQFQIASDLKQLKKIFRRLAIHREK